MGFKKYVLGVIHTSEDYEMYSSKALLTKSDIMFSAFTLFSKKGFNKTSVREIVEMAGVAKGTFYLYFETKEDILRAMYVRALEWFTNSLSTLDIANPSIEQIEVLIDYIVDMMQKDLELVKFLHGTDILELHNDKTLIEKETDRFVRYFYSWGLSAKEKGIVKKDVNELTFKILYLTIHEMLERAILYEFPSNVKDTKEELKKIIRLLLC